MKQPFCQSVVKWNRISLRCEMITSDGTLTFVMDCVPNKEFGRLPENRPFSKIEDEVMTAEQLMNK